MQSLLIPRKLKYEKSFFYLDYFHYGSWNMTNEIPHEKIQGALIVKNTSNRPMTEIHADLEEGEVVHQFPPNHFQTSLMNFVPKTITIAFEETFEGTTPHLFPFIKKEKERTASGVTISEDLEWDD
jgi:hypothetical protein